MTIDGTSGATFPDGSIQANAGSFTSLGTITLSGTGNQFSLTGLNLTSYKQLYITFNCTFGVSSDTSITNVTGDQTALVTIAKCGAANAYAGGFLWIDLLTGFNYQGQTSIKSTPVTFPVSIGAALGGGTTQGGTGITTATTTIYSYTTNTATKSGTITIYGVK